MLNNRVGAELTAANPLLGAGLAYPKAGQDEAFLSNIGHSGMFKQNFFSMYLSRDMKKPGVVSFGELPKGHVKEGEEV